MPVYIFEGISIWFSDLGCNSEPRGWAYKKLQYKKHDPDGRIIHLGRAALANLSHSLNILGLSEVEGRVVFGFNCTIKPHMRSTSQEFGLLALEAR